MIAIDSFGKAEVKLIHLAHLWNLGEAAPSTYDKMFEANPHELTALIGQGTTYQDWQHFLTDSRVQEYIDRVIYTRAGIIVAKYMREDAKVGVADATKLNSAIKYRDDHKPDFAIPVQYIYIATPLTQDEREFLPNIPENHVPGI